MEFSMEKSVAIDMLPLAFYEFSKSRKNWDHLGQNLWFLKPGFKINKIR